MDQKENAASRASVDAVVLLPYRYRWVYSEGYGTWNSIDIPSDWGEDRVREQMDYIEQTDGPRNGCRWSGFQFEQAM